MRLNSVVDDKLMQQATEACGLKTKREVVEKALRLMVKVNHQHKLLQVEGKLHWEGDLEEKQTSQ